MPDFVLQYDVGLLQGIVVTCLQLPDALDVGSVVDIAAIKEMDDGAWVQRKE